MRFPPASTANAAAALVWLFLAAPVASQEKPIASPRLAALAGHVEKGDSAAVEKFWNEISEKGAPLVEPAGSDTGEIWV
ncbi:MAG: hypothetical protein H6P98_2565, partial [Candidatus Aminicenantes bacterium]|nr:hypothetical protein [Candidatus Aminicenantes bacterium]